MGGALPGLGPGHVRVAETPAALRRAPRGCAAAGALTPCRAPGRTSRGAPTKNSRVPEENIPY